MRNEVSHRLSRPIRAATTSTTRLISCAVLVMFVLLLVNAQFALAQAPSTITIYVDTRAIDARADMTDDEKTAVKTAMKDEIKSNLESAFGDGSVTVTDDAAQREGADRTVTVGAGIGQETDGDGNTSYYWGEWEHGSSETSVELGTYMDSPPTNNGDDFKSGDPPQWDTAKLGKALGTTAAHELAHSYSAGHDDRDAGPGATQPNKLSSSNSSSEIGGGLPLNEAAKKTLTANRGKPPCKTLTDYKTLAALAKWWADFMTAMGKLLSEPFSITAAWNIHGPAASFFDIGWWSADTDNGMLDGNPWADFVYKSSMTGTSDDSPTITMFDGWTCHFVLRGRPGTPYEGQLFPVEPEQMIPGDFIVRPDGTEVARHLALSWDLNEDGVNDVTVNLMTGDPPNSPFNGFQLGVAPPIGISEAKLLVNGMYTHMTDVQVSSVFPDSFYVQATDRSSGIRVRMADMMPVPIHPGMMVTLSGRIETGSNRERVVTVLDPADLVPFGNGFPLRPLGMSNRDVGGGDYNYVAGKWPSGQIGVAGGFGTNNIGLLIRTWGRIVEVEPGFTPEMPPWIKIEDGTGRLIKCVAEEGHVIVDPSLMGEYAVVTGVSSCESEAGEALSVIRMTELQPIPGH